MHLVLVRHAPAEEKEEFAKKNIGDQFRPLTEKGKKRMQKVAEKLFELNPKVDLIVTSPYVRARESANILNTLFKTSLKEAVELVPQSTSTAFLRWLRAHGGDSQQIVVVGHEPHLSTMISYLISGQPYSFIDMKKSGVACLEIENLKNLNPGDAILKYLVPPKIWGFNL